MTDQKATAAARVRAAWRAEQARYCIGTITAGNTPVSVYLHATEERVWGPGPLWEAEEWVELRAAEAAIREMGLG